MGTSSAPQHKTDLISYQIHLQTSQQQLNSSDTDLVIQEEKYRTFKMKPGMIWYNKE
jgi:hypothetical protein